MRTPSQGRQAGNGKYPDKLVKGLDTVMQITGAKQGVICLKKKVKRL